MMHSRFLMKWAISLFPQISCHAGFPDGSDSKESGCNAGDPGSIPGLGRSPEEGNGNPLQYSCLENPMNRGTCRAIFCGVAKSRTRLSDWGFFFFSLHAGAPSLAEGPLWPASRLSFAARVEPHSPQNWHVSRVSPIPGITVPSNPCLDGADVIALHTDIAPRAPVAAWPVRLLCLIFVGQQTNIWN